MKRFAVIDLGTNTFHLLIAGRKSENEFVEIYRERIYVKLGKKGIGRFGKSALRRANDAMRKFRQIVDLFEAIEVRAFATEAFRLAGNANILIHRIHREFNIQVEIISGREEARLIYEGVKYSGALQRGENLIMDIGGGSVEFIIGTNEELSWSISLPIGASVLKNGYQRTEPISKMDLCALRIHLQKMLAPLTKAMEGSRFNTLIGASGTFDVLRDALEFNEVLGRCTVLRVQDFHAFRQEIETLDLDQRKAHELIPDNRADLIVVALILIDEVLSINPEFKFIIVSPFAMKEGMVVEMIGAYSF